MLTVGRSFAAIIFLIGALFVSSVAQAAPPPLETYGKLPGFEMATISPSGDHVALIGRVGDARNLILFDRDNKPIKVINLSHNSKVWSIDWAGDEFVLLHTSNTAALGYGFTADKAELNNVAVIPLDGTKLWSVFEKSSSITGGVRSFFGVTQRDDKLYGYFSGITLEPITKYLASASPVLYEVDLRTQRVRKIADRPSTQEIYRDWIVSKDGTVAAQLDIDRNTGNWSIFNKGRRINAKGANMLGDVRLVSMGIGGNSVIYAETDPKNGVDHWYEIQNLGGEAKEILTDASAGRQYVDARTRELIGYQVEGDVPGYNFYDPRHQKAMTAILKAFPGLSVQLISWNAAFDRVVVQTQGPGDPISWYVVDLKSKKADQLGLSYPMFSEDVGPMKVVRYKAQDGMDIEGVLTLPPGKASKDLPVILLPHGGPAARDYPGFDWWAQAFASRGYAVLQPNFRGSTGYGADFERAGHGQWGRKMQTDISDGLTYLVKQGIADPKRACIMGASYGGYAALAGVTLQNGIYRCAVSVAGVSNLEKLRNTDITESGNAGVVNRGMREILGSGSSLDDISPVRFAARADAPVLLIHGKDDVVVLYSQSTDMASALKRAGKPVELVTLQNGDHWLSTSETRLPMLNAAMAFVQKYNPADQ